jgi:bacterioferritin-associated ferredoxin
VRALLEAVGVPFEPATLRFFENDRAVRTVSSEQVRQPIYTRVGAVAGLRAVAGPVGTGAGRCAGKLARVKDNGLEDWVIRI